MGGGPYGALVGLGLIVSIGSLLGLILNGLLSSSHEGTLKCVMPIDIIDCTWLVCVQWCAVSWWILSWRVPSEHWDGFGEGVQLPPILGLAMVFEAPWGEVLELSGWVVVGL